jgi:hypothetical protein
MWSSRAAVRSSHVRMVALSVASARALWWSVTDSAK